jgi:hypothetical protein
VKTKKLKNLVKKVREELDWPIQELPQESGAIRIFSDPANRTHTLFMPEAAPEGGPEHETLYLHELGHALLCERVHPFFSNGFPIAGLDEKLLPAVSPILNAAGDWFVGQWLMECAPEFATDELHKEYEATAEFMEQGEMPSVEKFFVAVLIIAQSIKYLKKQVNYSGFLDAAVQAFLSVSPENPTVRKFEKLVNLLLALGAPYRCRRVNSGGHEVLEFYPAADEG